MELPTKMDKKEILEKYINGKKNFLGENIKEFL